MIKKLTRLLGNIVGRIKINMVALRIGVTCFSLPIGFGILLFAIPMKDSLSTGLFWALFSMVALAFITGMYSWWGAIKATYREQEIEYLKYIETRELLKENLKDLITEVKGLRQDLTKKE